MAKEIRFGHNEWDAVISDDGHSGPVRVEHPTRSNHAPYWLDYHNFESVGQALRQLMNFVEFGEDNDGQIVIYTNLTFESANLLPMERVVDMDTGVSV
jgi:hypothetical protein